MDLASAGPRVPAVASVCQSPAPVHLGYKDRLLQLVPRTDSLWAFGALGHMHRELLLPSIAEGSAGRVGIWASRLLPCLLTLDSLCGSPAPFPYGFLLGALFK